MKEYQTSKPNSTKLRSSGSAICSAFPIDDAIDATHHIEVDHPCCSAALAGIRRWLEIANLPNTKTECIKKILAIDLNIAEVDFTLSVISELIRSLETDITKEELKEFLMSEFKQNAKADS